jgi:thioredoxin 1
MSTNTHELTTQNFDEKVLGSDAPVLVDFWAEWCQPCRAIAPAIDRIAERFAGSVTVGKVDVDSNAPLAATHAVHAIPTILLFHRFLSPSPTVARLSRAVLPLPRVTLPRGAPGSSHP